MKLTVPYIEIPQPERNALPFDALGEKSCYIGNARLTMELALAIVAAYPHRAKLFKGLPEPVEPAEIETVEKTRRKKTAE